MVGRGGPERRIWGPAGGLETVGRAGRLRRQGRQGLWVGTMAGGAVLWCWSGAARFFGSSRSLRSLRQPRLARASSPMHSCALHLRCGVVVILARIYSVRRKFCMVATPPDGCSVVWCYRPPLVGLVPAFAREAVVWLGGGGILCCMVARRRPGCSSWRATSAGPGNFEKRSPTTETYLVCLNLFSYLKKGRTMHSAFCIV